MFFSTVSAVFSLNQLHFQRFWMLFSFASASFTSDSQIKPQRESNGGQFRVKSRRQDLATVQTSEFVAVTYGHRKDQNTLMRRDQQKGATFFRIFHTFLGATYLTVGLISRFWYRFWYRSCSCNFWVVLHLAAILAAQHMTSLC